MWISPLNYFNLDIIYLHKNLFGYYVCVTDTYLTDYLWYPWVPYRLTDELYIKQVYPLIYLH
jgi:hypothetical protein